MFVLVRSINESHLLLSRIIWERCGFIAHYVRIVGDYRVVKVVLRTVWHNNDFEMMPSYKQTL